MIYNKKIKLKNGKDCIIRNAFSFDEDDVCENMIDTHGETDFLLSYPDEFNFELNNEGEYLEKKALGENEVELCAFVGTKLIGTAGIDRIGSKYKIKHRAEFGISILKEYWGQGIGSALTESCIECAIKAGYKQLELEVVAENTSALRLYRKYGFVEYGRNPKAFLTRDGKYQEIILMRLELCNKD